MPNKELISFLENEGYLLLRYIPGRGLCGIRRMAFTVGLFYELQSDFPAYIGRYCFHNIREAIISLDRWDGNGDPSGNWIKHKGETEYTNPNYEENTQYTG